MSEYRLSLAEWSQLRWWEFCAWLRRCPECRQRGYGRGRSDGVIPRWEDDRVAQMLGIAQYGCPECGKGAIKERDTFAFDAPFIHDDGLICGCGPEPCPCGCPDDMHIGEIGCPCGLPDEPPCTPAQPTQTTDRHEHSAHEGGDDESEARDG